MSDHKVISMQSREQQSEREKAEIGKAEWEEKMLQDIATVENALRKTGADPLTLAYIFMDLSWILCNKCTLNRLDTDNKAARKRRGKGV